MGDENGDSGDGWVKRTITQAAGGAIPDSDP